ncbi:hypothetical protein NMY22_g12477 [Coprinellus aureogranulatus]|nr:hypothetical protein NMY22_g12477 [Coprinellus aureogranulatus]
MGPQLPRISASVVIPLLEGLLAGAESDDESTPPDLGGMPSEVWSGEREAIVSHWRNLSKHSYGSEESSLKFVYKVWADAGLQKVSGHSFRIGGAVMLLLAGVSPEVVAATGGWTSLAFLLYWRRVEEVLPMSTFKAYQKVELDKKMETFRVEQGLPAILA